MASCFYCDPDNENRKAIMFRVGKMREGVLYLFKDQAHKGRCVVAVDEHLSELSDLTPEQRHAFMDDVADVAGAVKKLWGFSIMVSLITVPFWSISSRLMRSQLCSRCA